MTKIARTVTMACLLTLFSSCVSTGPQNARIVQAKNTYRQGIIIGGLGGAAAGAIIGNQRGGREERLKGAAIGFAAGVVSGALWANHVVNQRNRYANAELYLDDCIKQADHTLARSRAFNHTLASEIERTEQGDASIAASIADSNEVLASIKREIGMQKSALSRARGERAARPKIAVLERRIMSLESERGMLESHIRRLSKLRGQPIANR